MLSSFDKSTATLLMDIGEWGLLISSIIVVFGIWAENRKSSLEWVSWHHIFEILVLIGVGGELLSDGIIFVSSDRLQTIQTAELSAQDKKLQEQEDKLLAQEGKLSTQESDLTIAKNDLAGAILDGKKSDLKIASLEAEAKASEEKIEVTKKETAKANERAAEANERAGKAELALAKMKAPRSLTGEQISAISDSLRPFSGQAYDLSVPRMMESGSALPTQLIIALQKAGWKLKSVESGFRRKATIFESLFSEKLPTTEGAHNFSIPDIEIGISDGWIGISICFELEDVMAPQGIEPHAALIDAFRDVGVEANLHSLSEEKIGQRSLLSKTDHATVHIIIGSKN